MLTKDKLRQSINKLPDSFTIDELIDQLIFIEKVEEGLEQSKERKVLSNENVKKIIEKGIFEITPVGHDSTPPSPRLRRTKDGTPPSPRLRRTKDGMIELRLRQGFGGRRMVRWNDRTKERWHEGVVRA